MKTNRNLYYSLIVFLAGFFFFSCEDYLDKSIEADMTEDQIFSTFPTFQGFVEKMYYDIIDFTITGNTCPDFNWGDDVVMSMNRRIHEGDYRYIAEGSSQTPYTYHFDQTVRGNRVIGTFALPNGVWNNGWMGIRDANIALSKLDMLVNPTAEERALLEGQAYFFRGYLHWAIMKQWGGIPYIDQVFSATDELKVPQLSFYECAEKVLADLEKAAELLPVDWDLTVVGQATLAKNRGRLTKGMALSFIAEVNLWCGSPLVHGVMTGNYTYNTEYCKKAAEAAWKVIELADQGVYTMQPWETYSDLIKRPDISEPGAVKEVIFKAPFQGRYARYICLQWVLPHLGGEQFMNTPTQNQVERFEMKATGLPIEDPESGFNPANPWVGRDPRFDFSIVKDKDRIVLNRNDAVAFAQFYIGGRDKVASAGTKTGFTTKKFTFTGWNSVDNQWGGNMFICLPIIRLAEIYLFYAEAVNEAYNPDGKHPEANLTAIDALNIVRNRAQMPVVHPKFTGSKELFRERVRNERSVELFMEAKRRDDLRRWYVAHETKYKDLYACDFPEDHSYFENRLIKSIVFDLRHYWFPFPNAQVLYYKDWKQNPGW